MQHICLAPEPAKYMISWLQSFNLDEALAKQNRRSFGALATQFESGMQDIKAVDENLVIKNIKESLGDLRKVIEVAGDGWLVGSGSWYDPCLDRRGIINTIIVFCIFFVLVLLIVCDYFLVKKTGGELLVPASQKALAWLHQCVIRQC